MQSPTSFITSFLALLLAVSALQTLSHFFYHYSPWFNATAKLEAVAQIGEECHKHFNMSAKPSLCRFTWHGVKKGCRSQLAISIRNFNVANAGRVEMMAS